MTCFFDCVILLFSRWLGTVVTLHKTSFRQAYTLVMSMLQNAVQKYSLHLVQSTSRHTKVIMVYAVKCSLYEVKAGYCRKLVYRGGNVPKLVGVPKPTW